MYASYPPRVWLHTGVLTEAGCVLDKDIIMVLGLYELSFLEGDVAMIPEDFF